MRRYVLAGMGLFALLIAVTFAQAQSKLNKNDFSIARIKWGQGDMWSYNRQWDHDWPVSEMNVMHQLRQVTAVNMTYEAEIVELSDPRLFEFTFAYMCEVQNCVLSPEEVAGLREYVLRGGFLMVDDSWSAYGLEHFRGQLKRAFPDRELERIDMDHPIFHAFYTIEEIPVIQPGRRWGRSIDAPQCYGITDDSGRLMVLLNWDNDVSDGWEWAASDPYDGINAYRLGINYILYSLSH